MLMETKSNMPIYVLGIDPGSVRTGYGIINASDSTRLVCLTQGYIPTRGRDLSRRLLQIYEALGEIIQTFQPHEVAIEQVFVNKNPQTALKLGQARGAALVATATYALPLAEYSPRTIKQAVVGYGAAAKTQVQQMVKALLKMTEFPQADAADALAIALCHCYHRQYSLKLAQALKGKTE